MKVKLTQKYIDNPPAVPPDKAKVEHCDTALPGLLWEQRAINQEWGSYRLRYKNSAGRTSYATVGRSCEITLAEARQKVKQLKAEIQLGSDPQHEVRKRRKGLLWDTFFTDHYLPHVKQHLRSWRNLEDMHRLRISDRIGKLKLDRIRKGEVQKFLNELKASGLSGATCDHHGKLIRQALGVAVSWGYLDSNSVSGIKLFNEDNQVERYLTNLVGRHLPLGVLLRDHRLFDAVEAELPVGDELWRAAAAADILTWRHQVLTDMIGKGARMLDVFPEDMTAPLINRYLEVKARHLL